MIKGVQTKEFEDIATIYCSFVQYGGGERTIDGLYLTTNSAQVTTYYRPDIDNDCRIKHRITGKVYELETQPENIEMRNQYMQFRVILKEGGA